MIPGIMLERLQYRPSVTNLRTTLPRQAALLALLVLSAGPASAGGGVMLQNDTCIITIGFYTAHFTAYQPQTRGDEEFCEDLPDIGEAVFVLDYLHDSLKDVPVDFRIIENATGLGTYAGPSDIRALGDLDTFTVFYRPPTVEADASYQISHVFETPGDYVGIVTAGHPSNDKTFVAFFPFSVGVGGFPYVWVIPALAVLFAGVVAFFWLRPRSRPHRVAA
ncbi:MAG: hypothetical protein RIC56_08040 [Pseudomonadales bacterium]